MSSRQPRVRFRHHGALVVAALVAAIGAIPLASAGWYYLPALAVPLLVGWWAWWSGTDADAHGLRLRAAFGQRTVPWPAVAELAADARGRAFARLVDGRQLPLPAVPADALPRLAAASGHPLSAGDSHT